MAMGCSRAGGWLIASVSLVLRWDRGHEVLLDTASVGGRLAHVRHTGSVGRRAYSVKEEAMSDEEQTPPQFVYRLRRHDLMSMTRGDENFTSEDCESYVLSLTVAGEDLLLSQDTSPVADIIVYDLGPWRRDRDKFNQG